MKAKNVFMSVLAAGCLSVACLADAASVAFIPLVDNSHYEDKEELNATYQAAVIRTINNVEGFTLVDSDALTAVLDKNIVEGVLPNEQILRTIAEQAGVDVVFAMQLDELSSTSQFTRDDDRLTLDLKGKVVYYNALTGKFKKTTVMDDTRDLQASYARSNFELSYFANNVRHEVNRALGNKKIKLEKPRLGW